MRRIGASVSVGAVLLLAGIPGHACVTALQSSAMEAPHGAFAATPYSDMQRIRASLRRDVARHPSDFIVFPTRAGAMEFFAEHRASVEVETDPTMIERGVVGYSQGKTVVVLPWLPTAGF